MEHGFWHRLYSREPQGGRKGIGWLAKEPAADSPAEDIGYAAVNSPAKMLDAQSRTVPAEVLDTQSREQPRRRCWMRSREQSRRRCWMRSREQSRRRYCMSRPRTVPAEVLDAQPRTVRWRCRLHRAAECPAGLNVVEQNHAVKKLCMVDG